MSKNYSCIVCHKELEEVNDEGPDRFYPYHAVEFVARGHYGSTVFDPMDGTDIRACICDECIVDGINHNRIIGTGVQNI